MNNEILLSIINIEINNKKLNEHHNVYSLISQLENFISDLDIKDVVNKTYHTNIRESMEGYIIRNYINETIKIYTKHNNSIINISNQNIKNTICNVELELGILWITDDKFGILWYLKEIELVTSL